MYTVSTQTPKERALKVLQDPTKMIDASNTDINQMYQELIVKEHGIYMCKVCEKSMGHKANMERHVETHMTGLSYECKHCGETFRSRHVLKHHNNKTCINNSFTGQEKYFPTIDSQRNTRI